MASEDKLEQVLTSMRNNKVAMKGIHTFDFDAWDEVELYASKIFVMCGFTGKIHTPMEFKGELASYEMKLRY